MREENLQSCKSLTVLTVNHSDTGRLHCELVHTLEFEPFN